MSSFLLFLFFGLCGISSAIVYYEPQQVHVASGSPYEMTIVWNTFMDPKDTRVYYGLERLALINVVAGTRKKFVDGGSEKRVQYVHTVQLTGLKNNTVYFYIVGSKYYAFSDTFAFKTWQAGENWSPSLAIYGDMGNVNAQSLPRLQTEVARGMYDAVLHVGDFAYDMDTDNARVGDEFMRQIEPIATAIPYMTCPGNHENRYNFSNYKNRFRMPGDIKERMFYSFKMGPILFISLNTESFFYIQYGLTPMVEQYAWLEQELIEANKPENRARQPWIIAFGHRPMYCSNTDGDDCTQNEGRVRTGIPILHYLGWEKLFFKYGVDVALWAHEHNYERLWPIYDRQVLNGSYNAPYTNPKAPVHITTGSAGCQEKHDPMNNTEPSWSAFRASDYGYTRMKVFNATHLYMEQVSDDKEGQVIDRVLVIKDKHGPYPNPPTPAKPLRFQSRPMKKLKQSFKMEYLLRRSFKLIRE